LEIFWRRREPTILEGTRLRTQTYNVSGKLARVLVEGRREARHYKGKWNGQDDNGARVASRAYFYRVTAGSFTKTKRVVSLK